MAQSEANPLLLTANEIRRNPSAVRNLVGEKAYGLAQIPEAWTPRFATITTSACDSLRQGNPAELRAAIRLAIETLKWTPSTQVIVRSSAHEEGLHCRGRFESHRADATEKSMKQQPSQPSRRSRKRAPVACRVLCSFMNTRPRACMGTFPTRAA